MEISAGAAERERLMRRHGEGGTSRIWRVALSDGDPVAVTEADSFLALSPAVTSEGRVVNSRARHRTIGDAAAGDLESRWQLPVECSWIWNLPAAILVCVCGKVGQSNFPGHERVQTTPRRYQKGRAEETVP